MVAALVAEVALEVELVEGLVTEAPLEAVVPETVAGLVVTPVVALEVVAVVLDVVAVVLVAVVLVAGVTLLAGVPLLAEVTLLAEAVAPLLMADETLVGLDAAAPCLTVAELL